MAISKRIPRLIKPYSFVVVALSAIALTLIVFALYVGLKPLYVVRDDTGGTVIRAGVIPQTLTFVCVTGVAVYGAACYFRRSLTVGKMISMIILAALFIRIGYMLVTAPNSRQYDTFTSGFNGHESYAYTIYSKNALPETNSYQFYHPPLNAFLQATFMRFTNAVSKLLTSVFDLGDYFAVSFNEAKPSYLDGERYYLYGTCQVLSLVYSYLTLIVGLKILKAFGLKGKSLVIGFAFFAFFPRHVGFAATLNNDPLAYLNSLIAIYFAIKWWLDGKRLSDILLCGLFIGLGVCTKLSAATVCLPIGAVFAYEFIKTILKRNGSMPLRKIIVQYLLFIAVCAPISLSFIVYAKIKFDQPLGYVFSNLNKLLSTTHHSAFERFFITFDADEFFYSFYLRTFTNPSTGVYNNYNMYNFLVRSSIFGEFGYWQGEAFSSVALLSQYSLTLVLPAVYVVILVCYIKEKKRTGGSVDFWGVGNDEKAFVFGTVLFLTNLISIAAFYIKMPYSCTVDFRYVMPIIISVPLMLSGVRKYVGEYKAAKVVSVAALINVAVFLTSSSLFFMTAI